MTKVETTDYLIVGAGASGLAVADEIVRHSDATVTLADRRHEPGGHWVDAYPFVRLHQPSAYYGVNSRPLGNDRIDVGGINDGFYERATGHEVASYYRSVLDDLMASGRVRWMPMVDYRGESSGRHQLVSRLDGTTTEVAVARRVVNATIVASEVPSRHAPPFAYDDDMCVVAPNELTHLDEPADGFVIIGAGKTAMDTVVWLIGQGVEPDRIRWVRPRDAWLVDRAHTQPFDLVGSMVAYQARTIEACGTAQSGQSFARQLEDHGMMCRVDPAFEALTYRGAVIAREELAILRMVEQVVRHGRVRSIGPHSIQLDEADVPTSARTVHVNCTAQGLATAPTSPIYAEGRIDVQFTTLGVAPWSAAILGFVETLDIDDDERNRLCPPVPRTGLIADQLRILAAGLEAEGARRDHPDIAAWSQQARLNPTRSMAEHFDDPAVMESLTLMLESVEPAVANLSALAEAGWT
ncbi:MAG: NAD(P)-binding protein [Actinomycetota bacterium]